ncbi:hypothetical protein PIROE2DRAFT_19218 [Piromyces sp. E2]|nr:hypothetical protein PIROE2DRAFT_19218 [Piromyces sp. E2]|eukprot:OUM56248.1 hypothetical protein PIROE2DRAFT_19218 [Piromyces sp. E2]
MRNGGNDCKYTRIRDNLNQYLIGNRGIETQQNDQVIMFIDGEYWGIYSIYEDYDEHYIENNYGIDNKNVIMVKKDKVEAGVDSDLTYFNETIDFLNAMDMSEPKNMEEASKKFDIEGFAWVTAFHLYANVQDSILKGSNWAMWRVREPDNSVSPVADGKWRVLLFDTEYSLGMYSGGTNYDQNLLDGVFNPEASLYSRFGSKILKSLLKNPEFKNLFINALSDVRNIDFETKRVNSVIDKMAKRLYPVINEFFERFPAYNLYEENPEQYYRNEISLLKEWLQKRNEIFLNLVSRTFDFQPPVNVTISSNDFRKGSFIVNGGWKVFEKKYSGEYFRENILYLTAKPSSSARKLHYWKLKNCKFADKKYANLSNSNNKSTSKTIGIYPDENCRVTAYFK